MGLHVGQIRRAGIMQLAAPDNKWPVVDKLRYKKLKQAVGNC